MNQDVAAAEELINWYKNSGSKALWGVAENFRYISSVDYAATEVQKLGRVLNFRGRLYNLVQPGGKYFGMLYSYYYF